MSITCYCGAATKTESPFVSAAVKQGWTPLLGRDGSIHYVCPNCISRVKEAAELIVQYSNQYVSLTSLIRASSQEEVE